MEPDTPQAVVDGFQADCFAFQCMGDEHISIGPSHLASRRDSAHLPISGVFRLLDPFRKAPRRRLIVTIRSLLPKRLMRALFVVLLTKPVEAFLLAALVGRWRRRGLLRACDACVRAVRSVAAYRRRCAQARCRA